MFPLAGAGKVVAELPAFLPALKVKLLIFKQRPRVRIPPSPPHSLVSVQRPKDHLEKLIKIRELGGKRR